MNSFFKKRQKKSWDYIKKYYPQYKSKSDYYKKIVEDYLKPDVIMADLGCGKGLETPLNYKERVKKAYGIDISEDIHRNETIHNPIMADLGKIPLKNDCLDLVVSQEVIEHLEFPGKMFSEVSRILKPGGHFILMTPNLYYPTTFVSSLTPLWFHRYYAKHLLDLDSEENMFLTFYRANTLKSLKKLGENNNLNLLSYDFFQCNPGQFSFSLLLTYLEVGFIRSIEKYRFLEQFRDIIIIIMRK